MIRRSRVIRVVPAPPISPVRILPIRVGSGWHGAELLADGRAGCWLCPGAAPLLRA